MPLRMLAALCLLAALPAVGQVTPQTVSPVGRPASQAVTVQTAGTAPLAVTGSLSVSGAADTVGNSATYNANSVCATVLLAGQQSVGFNLATGTLAATLTPSLSQDATPATPGCTGGTWTATSFVDTSGNTSATLVVTNPNSAYFAGLKTLGGARCARVCTTSYTSGSAAGYLVATTVPSPPPAAGADVTDRAGRLLGQLTDGSSAITPAKTGQLPTALDGSGYLKTHEQGTAAISAASLPLPTGAATSAKQPALGTAGSSSTDVLSVQGIASGTALPVSAASLPLPTGASTAAKQPALGTAGTASSDVITVQGITSMTPLKTDGSGVTQPVSGTIAATQSGTWTVQPGNTANTTAWKVDGSAVTQPVSGTVNAAQSGTWNITNVSGTVSLPTGAATSAKQPALGAAGSASTDVITVQGIASMTALKTDGSAVTQPVSGTVTANAGTGTMATSNAALALAQGSTTSGQTGPLLQGAVTTAAPTYTTAQTDPLSLTTAGGLRADLLSVNGTTILTGNGTAGAGAQRVTIASDNTAFSVNATLQAGSNTIGAVTAPGAAALALDASVTGLQVSQGSTTSGQKGSLLLGAVTTGSPSYTTAQSSPLSLDTSGNLRVNVVAGGGSGGTSSSFGSSFPSTGTAIGAKDSSGTNMAALNLDASGYLKVNVAAGGGSGGTSSSFGSAVPATGTATGYSDGTNMQSPRAFDADTGGGTQYVAGANLRISGSGGSIEAKGQQTSANSIPVVLPSDYVPADTTAGPTTISASCADANINTPCSANTTVALTTTGQAFATAQLANSNLTCTMKADYLSADGTTWVLGAYLVPGAGPAVTSIAYSGDSTTATLGVYPPPGIVTSGLRVRCSTAITNTTAVTLRAGMFGAAPAPWLTSAGGTAPPLVASVQGVSGGTALPASQSGTWTVQPGNTANTTPWLASNNDGTNTQKVLGASTAAAAADKAAVVALSPSSPVYAGVDSAQPSATNGTPSPFSLTTARELRVDPAGVFTVSAANQGLSAVTTATAGSTINLDSAQTNGVLNGPRSVNTHKCVLTMGGTSVSAAAVVVQASHDGGTTWFGIPGGWTSPAISKTGVYESGANGWYPKVRCNLITFTGSSPTATVTYFGWNGKQDPAPGAYFRCQTNNNSATTSTTVSTDTGAIGGVSSTTACANPAAIASIAMSITGITYSASVASTTTSNQQMILQMGTSTACTSPVVLWSAYGPATGGATVRFAPGELTTANANSLCFLHAATGSKSVTVTGIYGPWNG